MNISHRTVYQHILSQPNRTITIRGKAYLHTRIATDLGAPFAERAVRDILVELVKMELLTLVSRKTICIAVPIDPATLPDEPASNELASAEPVALPGSRFQRLVDSMPPLPQTQQTVAAATAGLAPGPSDGRDEELAAEAAAAQPTPSPASPSTAVDGEARNEGKGQRGDELPDWARAEIDRLTTQRNSATRRLKEVARGTALHNARADIARFRADNARLQREQRATVKEIGSLRAQLADRSTITPMPRVMWHTVTILIAIHYQREFALAQIRKELSESRRNEAELAGMNQTLERRLTHEGANAEVQRLTALLARRDEAIKRLEAARARLTGQVTDLKAANERYERDADFDAAELANMIANLDEANRALTLFKDGRLIQKVSLIDCGHTGWVGVEADHKPGPGSLCHELELTEIAKSR